MAYLLGLIWSYGAYFENYYCYISTGDTFGNISCASNS